MTFHESPVLGLTVISGDRHVVHMDIVVPYVFLPYKIWNSAKMHYIYCMWVWVCTKGY
jgi:hypothetical protein